MFPSFRPRLNRFLYAARKQPSLLARQFSAVAVDRSKPGLFSLPFLHEPEDFLYAAEETVMRCNSIIDIIKDTTTPSIDTLRLLDMISDLLCQVLDTAEAVRNIHFNPEWRDAANRTFQTLHGYLTQINGDKDLYDALARILSTEDVVAIMSEEEIRVADLLKREFEKDGIHLSERDRAAVSQLNDVISRLEHEFIKSTHQSQDVNHAKGTAPVLHRLVEKRSQLARKVGFPSFAQMAMHNRMMRSPAAVRDFLLEFAEVVKPKAQAEVETLRRLKAEHEGTKFEDTTISRREVFQYKGAYLKAVQGEQNPLAAYLPIHAVLNGVEWVVDEVFGLELKRVPMTSQEVWAPNSLPYLNNPAEEGDSSFFGKIQRFTKNIMKNPGGGETTAWMSDYDDLGRKYELSTKDGKLLGIVYLDPFTRPGKYGGSAHFVIRCGRSIHHFEEDPTGVRATAISETETGERRQLPIGILTLNLPRPNLLTGEGVVLSAGNARTLFHEFGHALHMLLSQTELQHLSGTRGPLDFVEVPSYLMEHFVTDPDVAVKWMKHYLKGEPPSADTVRRHFQIDSFCRAIEMEQQLIHSMLDQAIYLDDPTGYIDEEDLRKEIRGATEGRHLADLWRQYRADNPDSWSIKLLELIHKKHGSLPFKPEEADFTRYPHFATYPAGYYTYLFAEVVSASIWSKVFKSGLDLKTAGARFKREVLTHGGAREAETMLRGLTGTVPSIKEAAPLLGLATTPME